MFPLCELPEKCPDCNSVAITLPPLELGDGKCADCYGIGVSPNIFERCECETCGGTGTCQTCGGTGEV